MQVEIYINEEKLDTNSKTVIAETKQINDFLEISDIQTSYTNAFKLPKTARNIKVLGGMGLTANTSLFPYRVHKVSIYRDGIQTISEGVGYFKPTNDYFNMFVYNDNISLFDEIKDKTIADLNLTSLNHTLNIENWIASFNREDYTYALADYGVLNNNEVEINYQVPSLFVNYLWNKIFAESNFYYKYKGREGQDDYNPFITDEWKETAITIDEGLPKNEENSSKKKLLELFKDNITQLESRYVTIFGNRYFVNEIKGEQREYVKFTTVLDDNYLHQLTNSNLYNRSRIRIKEDGFYELKLSGNVYNLNTEILSLVVEKDNIDLFTINDNFNTGQTQIGFTEKIYLKQGDEIFVKFLAHPKDKSVYYTYDLSLELFLDNSVTYVNFSSYFSKIKQKDFIKDTMSYYGLMCRRKGSTYEFISIQELLDPSANYLNQQLISDSSIYLDWSNKFHKVLEDDSQAGNYARLNHLRYQYDNSDNNFADGSISIDDEKLDNEKTLFQRIYKAPENSTETISNLLLRKCYLYDKELNDDGTIKSVKAKKNSCYFFRVTKTNTSITYKISGAIGTKSYSGEIPLMSFENLDFNHLIPIRYSALANTINYGQRLKLEVYLSVLDIHNLDFFKLIYFKQLGQLYYLCKPIKFIKNGLNQIEVIRVRTIEKQGQFSDEFSDDFNN